MSRRVAVVGVSGNGKTTFARRLAAKLDVPYTELDALNHLPGWVEASDGELRRYVLAVMGRSDGWVLDGSYQQKLGDLVLRRADTLVWLDYPLWLVLWRLFWRTNRRIIQRERLWNDNRERFSNAYLSKDSLYVWVFRSYWRRRRMWPRFLAEPMHAGLVVHRFRSPAEATRWLHAAPSEFPARTP